MALTRGEIAGRILRLVNKTASNPGFYTPAKVNDSIEDALDFLAVDMFLAGEGWQDKMKHFTTRAGQVALKLSADVAMVKEVRILFGGVYMPLIYDDGSQQAQSQVTSGVSQYPCRYRILDNMLYFNPPLSEGVEDGIQLEYMTFPKRLENDADVVEGHLWKPFVHWVAYWAASRLVAGVGTPDPDWSKQEALWYGKVQAVIVKRNLQTTTIREFEG